MSDNPDIHHVEGYVPVSGKWRAVLIESEGEGVVFFRIAAWAKVMTEGGEQLLVGLIADGHELVPPWKHSVCEEFLGYAEPGECTLPYWQDLRDEWHKERTREREEEPS